VNIPLRRSGIARVLKGSRFYLHTPRSSANGMNHTYLCLTNRSWYSFTDPGGREGWVGLFSSLWKLQIGRDWIQHTGVPVRMHVALRSVAEFCCMTSHQPITRYNNTQLLAVIFNRITYHNGRLIISISRRSVDRRRHPVEIVAVRIAVPILHVPRDRGWNSRSKKLDSCHTRNIYYATVHYL